MTLLPRRVNEPGKVARHESLSAWHDALMNSLIHSTPLISRLSMWLVDTDTRDLFEVFVILGSGPDSLS